MAMKKDVEVLLNQLSQGQLEDVSAYILNVLTVQQSLPISEDARLINGIVCPNCGSASCVKNGSVRKKQRFLCRDCKKTFGLSTKSPLMDTKLSTKKWQTYIGCMIEGYSLRKCAEIVGVCLKTSFYMRHKILDAIRLHVDEGDVSGMVEMDETFFAESFKGNHKKSKVQMPRKSRKRGKQVEKRGLSREQICVGTAIDKNGNMVIKMACKGRITTKLLEKMYDGRIAENSIVCTDSLSSYKTLSKKLKFKHKAVPRGQHSNGMFNLSRINSLHSRLKGWMYRFKGVSTKFLPNYLNWFKWLEANKNLKESTKPNHLWNDSMSEMVDVRICTIREREPVWV